jgi:hypothetical protein
MELLGLGKELAPIIAAREKYRRVLRECTKPYI